MLNSKNIINYIVKNGFANAGNCVFSTEEIEELSSLIANAYQESCLSNSVPNHDCLSSEGGAQGLSGLPQHHPRIAELIDKIFSSSLIKEILVGILGEGYKIWQINYRTSLPGDRGLAMHQDSFGEFNLCLMLTDNPRGVGSTYFVKGSHLFKGRLKDMKIIAPNWVMRYLRVFTTPLSGRKGDIGFFLNRTWHGRSSNNLQQDHRLILISLFPAGARYGFNGYSRWSPQFYDSPTSEELKKLVNPFIGTKQLAQGQFLVSANSREDSSQSCNFATSIETGKNSIPFLLNLKLETLLIFLKPGKFLYPAFSILRSKIRNS